MIGFQFAALCFRRYVCVYVLFLKYIFWRSVLTKKRHNVLLFPCPFVKQDINPAAVAISNNTQPRPHKSGWTFYPLWIANILLSRGVYCLYKRLCELHKNAMTSWCGTTYHGPYGLIIMACYNKTTSAPLKKSSPGRYDDKKYTGIIFHWLCVLTGVHPSGGLAPWSYF